MIQHIELVPITSLTCVCIHAAIWWPGMIGHPIRLIYRALVWWLIGQCPAYSKTQGRIYNIAAYLIKPFYACLFCMASVWTLVMWYWYVGTITWDVVPVLLLVGGCNALLDTFIYHFREHDSSSL
jgi:hypothetical protein